MAAKNHLRKQRYCHCFMKTFWTITHAHDAWMSALIFRYGSIKWLSEIRSFRVVERFFASFAHHHGTVPWSQNQHLARSVGKEASFQWNLPSRKSEVHRWRMMLLHIFLNFHGLLHPWKLTWNLKITKLKRNIIFQASIFDFHVNFPGCIFFPPPAFVTVYRHNLK